MITHELQALSTGYDYRFLRVESISLRRLVPLRFNMSHNTDGLVGVFAEGSCKLIMFLKKRAAIIIAM